MKAFENASAGLAIFFSKEKAQRELEDAYKALIDANEVQDLAQRRLKAAEDEAKRVGL